MKQAREEISLTNSTNKFQVERADAVEWLRKLPAGGVNLIITDPAYESLEKHRAVGTTTRLKKSKGSNNEWFEIFPNARFADLFSALYRALAPNSHLYLFCDAETAFIAKPIAEASKFHFWKPLIWDKKHIGMGYHYRSRYEFILFFEKGKRRLNNLGTPDVLESPRIRNGYPTEKPVPLIEILVEQSSQLGDLVADPFCGSGTTALAALNLGRRFTGADLSPTAVQVTNERIKQHGY